MNQEEFDAVVAKVKEQANGDIDIIAKQLAGYILLVEDVSEYVTATSNFVNDIGERSKAMNERGQEILRLAGLQ